MAEGAGLHEIAELLAVQGPDWKRENAGRLSPA